MPQMSPMNWLSLFIIFSITFFMYNVMNYFLFLPSNSNVNNKYNNPISPPSLIWTW